MRIGRIMAVAGALIIGSASSAAAQPAAAPKPDDTVNNPPFAHWSAFKPGTTVTQKQVVSLSDGRKVEHVITAKLLQKSKERLVVETTVKDNAKGMVESTRTVTSYPAKVKAGQVHTPATADVSVTEGKEEVTGTVTRCGRRRCGRRGTSRAGSSSRPWCTSGGTRSCPSPSSRWSRSSTAPEP